MCNHNLNQVNDVFVCQRCGLTRTYDGKILFDRKLPNMKLKKRKGKKK